MHNWTDKIIPWNQLPATEVKRLLATWGKDEAFIAKYDKKHGFKTEVKTPVKTTAKVVPVEVPKKVVAKPAVKTAVKKAPTRQKHTGADGEVKFVDHRNLYVGFFGGRVVVTKRTPEQCLEVLRKDYNLEV
jgi:predicted sulfurtransferase